MDAIFGGVLTGVTMAVATLYWHLLVHPDLLLSLWHDGSAAEESWFQEHPAGLRALRWAAGSTLLLLGFLTGLVWAFLLSTSR